MRRGLIARSKTELPDDVLDARLARLRAAMIEAGLDALIIYTNNTQTAGVSWLTGFVPYWSEALLVVPRNGAPRLVAALSFRVKSWIERTSRVADVIHAPRIGLEAGRMIAASKAAAAVGIVDFGCLSAGIVDDLTEGGPRLALSDASVLFALMRSKADSAEIALFSKAAAIAQRALGEVGNHRQSLGEIIAAVEGTARGLGCEEIYIAAAPDLVHDQRMTRVAGERPLGETFALRATVAYKGCWIRLGRTYFRNVASNNFYAQAAEEFATAIAQLPSVQGFKSFSFWLVEGCRTTQPLAPLMGSGIAEMHPPAAGMLVSVQARRNTDGQHIYISAPALLGDDGGPAGLLVDLLSD